MKKALKIIAISLFVALAIFSVVAYILWKEQTTYITECIINFINKPLPIIGVSIAIICYGLFKCFVYTKYGKKTIQKYENDVKSIEEKTEQLKKFNEEYKKYVDTKLDDFANELGIDRETLLKHLELSKNIKDKDLIEYLKGEQPYGEEEVDSQEETETL